MNGNRASGCMCCGAPWPPIHDEVVDLDRLGNRSLLWLHRMFVTDPHMREKFGKPKLYDAEHASHMLHESHHRWAVDVMARRRLGDGDMIAARDAAAPHHDTGRGFPFLRNPTSTHNSAGYIASWAAPPPENRLVQRELITAMAGGGYPDDEYQDDFELTLANCKSCNAVMTQEFFFRYHLYAGDRVNPHRLIRGQPITLWRVTGATVDMDDIPDWAMTAQVMRQGQPEEYPLARYDERKDIMTAAVGYYLHMCLPGGAARFPDDFDAAEFTVDFRALYLHMCWVVLEVACLISEFTRGNRSLKSGHLRQAPKSHLGAIEQYLSYFGYRILCWHTPALERVGFPAWHQLFFWFAWRCDGLFDANARRPPLWAYAVMPQGSEELRSKRLVRAVSRLMVDQLGPLGRLRDHILGRNVPPLPPGVSEYFLTERKMGSMVILLRRGTKHDLDSYLEQVLQVDLFLLGLRVTARAWSRWAWTACSSACWT